MPGATEYTSGYARLLSAAAGLRPLPGPSQLVSQFNQLKVRAIELKSRNLLYVPIVPEGHNQPIPASKVPTARLSEDELAAMRHRFKVEADDFLVILIGKDGGEKLNSRTPVTVDQLEKLIDSMPMHKRQMQPEPRGEQ
jgi:hypothetical protein